MRSPAPKVYTSDRTLVVPVVVPLVPPLTGPFAGALGNPGIVGTGIAEPEGGGGGGGKNWATAGDEPAASTETVKHWTIKPLTVFSPE